MFHRHDWELLDKAILPSAYQQLREGERVQSIKNGAPIFFQTKVVYVFRCRICGKVKTVTESNP